MYEQAGLGELVWLGLSMRFDWKAAGVLRVRPEKFCNGDVRIMTLERGLCMITNVMTRDTPDEIRCNVMRSFENLPELPSMKDCSTMMQQSSAPS